MSQPTVDRALMSQTELAKHFEVNRRTIQNWDDEGMAKVARRSERPVQYDALEAWKWRWEHKRSDGTGVTVADARSRKLDVQARLAELELEREEGRLVPVEDHRKLISRLVEKFRATILALPGGWGARITGLRSPAEGTEAMKRMTEEVLMEMVRFGKELKLEALADKKPLPPTFPARAKLAAAGIDTFESLRAVGDLTAIAGVGRKTADAIDRRLASP